MKTQLFEAARRSALKQFRNTLWIVNLTQRGNYFNKWLGTNSPTLWDVLGFHFLSVFFPSCSPLSSLCWLLSLSGSAEGEKVLSSAPLKGDPNRVLTRMPSLTGTDSSSYWALLCVYTCVCEGRGLVPNICVHLLWVGKHPWLSLITRIFFHTHAWRNVPTWTHLKIGVNTHLYTYTGDGSHCFCWNKGSLLPHGLIWFRMSYIMSTFAYSSKVHWGPRLGRHHQPDLKSHMYVHTKALAQVHIRKSSQVSQIAAVKNVVLDIAR